jgi:site-specific DNA-methyltransferase (adenine-specific)
LLRELIEMSSRHGETVLDPCMGSGSTLVAALLEGRKAIGVELETQWAEVAVKRLQDATQQGALFGFDAEAACAVEAASPCSIQETE